MADKEMKTLQFPGSTDVYHVVDEEAREAASSAVKTVNGQAPDETGNVQVAAGVGGTTDYNSLANRPSIGGVTLTGDKTLDDLGAVKVAQGTEAANKFLGTDENGNVVIKEVPDSAVTVDDTLTKSGQAADAAVVGEELRNLSSDKAPVLLSLTNTYATTNDNKVSTVRDNLFDNSTQITGKYILATGELGKNDNACVSEYIDITAGITYGFQYVGTYTYVGSIEKLAFYDENQEFICMEQPWYNGTQEFFVSCVAPDNATYARISFPASATQVMFSIGSTIADYVEFGVDVGEVEESTPTSKYTVYIASDPLAEAIRNVDNPEYQLYDYMVEDKDGVAEWVVEHAHNGSYACRITPNNINGNTVTFQGFSLYPKNDYCGLWIYASRNAIGPTTGRNLAFTVSLNDVNIDTYDRTNLTAGMQYLQVSTSGITAPITKIKITVTYSDENNIPSLYVASVSSGKLHKTPMVIWTHDCTASNFYVKGYPLFRDYKIPANFDYHPGLSSGAGTSWTDSSEALCHFEMLANNMGYGIYSTTRNYPGTIPTDYATGEWGDFATYLWRVCNEWGIFGPNMVHSANHYVGAAYNKAMITAGFPIIRHAQKEGATVAYFDQDTREFPCSGLSGGWEDPSSVLVTFKQYVDGCIKQGADIMIITHSILDSDDGSGLNISTEAITLCLEYLHNLHQAGVVQAVSVEEFLSSRAPELYASWQKHKQADEQRYCITR